jgi:3-oxoacyl-[acyl-carrier-protein] synthase-3
MAKKGLYTKDNPKEILMAQRYGNIIGWGKYVPENVITNFDLEKKIDTTDEWIVQRSGIHERRVVGEDEQISEMATAAGRKALKMAGIRPRELDLIIVATSSPDYLTPPISSQVQHALGAKNVGAFTLVTGCTGFVYSLVTAQQFIAAGTCDKVLVVGAELITRFIDYTDRTTCILFGDGAGAVVMEGTEDPAGVLSYTLGSDGSQAERLILPGGGSRNPPSLEMLEQKMQYVHMDGNEVFKFATRILGKSLRQVIKDANLTPDDIDLFIPHQANKRIIKSAARQARLPEEKVFINIHKYGNTSAASIPIALCEALDEGRAKIGDTLAFVAFGAGLTWAAAVVKLIEREIPKKTRKLRLPFFSWFSRKKETAAVPSPE